MKRPRIVQHKRPGFGDRRIPKIRTEAAVALVRVEYERARLTREVEQLARRRAAALSSCARASRRADRLIAALAMSEDAT